MALLEVDRIIKDYYETVKDKYPDINFRIFEEICKAPFRFFVAHMAREEKPIIHIKGLGRFVVLASRVEHLIIQNRKQLKHKHITQEVYEEQDKYLKELLEKVKKYEAAHYNGQNFEVEGD